MSDEGTPDDHRDPRSNDHMERDERYLLTEYDADQWAAAHPNGEPVEFPHVLAHLRAEHIYRNTYPVTDASDLNPFFLAHPAVDAYPYDHGSHCHSNALSQ